MSHVTPMGALARGLAAGVAGTALMTAWQEASKKLRSSGSSESQDESHLEGGGPSDPWEQASVPAQVARRILAGVFDKEVAPARIGLLTNVTHWVYGTSWGAVYGLIQSTWRGRALTRGALFGTSVWVSSYLTLVPMGLYAPPWTYSPPEAALDISYHLAYGIGTGIGYALVDR